MKLIDIAVALEADADKLPDLVFSKAGKLVSGDVKTPPEPGDAAPLPASPRRPGLAPHRP